MGLTVVPTCLLLPYNIQGFFVFTTMQDDSTPSPNYYAIIPASVRYCDDVCPNAKLLYGEITALSNASGYCYAGNRYFAELYKLKRLQTISDWIKQLEKNGFISVELTYKGKEIDQRIIRLTPNEKTLDVQRKNDIGTTKKRCTPTTKKRCVNNTSINNTSNTTFNRGKSGDFQSPIAPPKAADEKAEFSEWLAQNNFIRLSKTSFFLEKEKSCAKKEKHGEAGYLQALADIEKHLGDDPQYIAKRKDFSRVFDKFAKSTELIAAKNDLNRVFSAKFGTPYTTDTKSAETALESIISKLQVYNGNLKITETIALFFDRLATLPKFDNPTAWKPAFINSDFSEIIALLKNNKAQPSRGETYKERDARLEREKREADKARLKASAEYDAMRAQIIRILDNGGELQDFHKASQAYKDMFNGDQTPF